MDNCLRITKTNFYILPNKSKNEEKTLPQNHNTRNLVLYTLTPILPIRRTASLPDDIENHNLLRALGMVLLASIFFPEDIRDLRDCLKHLGSKVSSKIKYGPKFNYNDYQVSFAFFRGSSIQFLVNKLGKVGYYLHKSDITLFDTKFGKFIRNLLHVKIVDTIDTGRKIPVIIKDETGNYIKKDVSVFAQKLSGSFISKMICRSTQRIMLWEVAIFSAAWLPTIIKSFLKPNQGENKYKSFRKQLVKSVSNVVVIFGSIGLVGAIGSRKGPLGHILGMGAGATIGMFTSNKINEKLK